MKVNFSITSNSSPSGCHAFPKGSDFKVSISVSGTLCEHLWFYIGNDDRVILSTEVPFDNSPDTNGFFAEIKLNTRDLDDRDGLYFCHFEFVSNGRRYFAAFDSNENCYLADHFVNEAQILVYDEKYASPDWLFGGNIYQIFPDRFARAGKINLRSDAVYDGNWENGIPEHPTKCGEAFPNNTHFGGSLYGVISRLDYLASLGINCIYLNPIFEAFSNHKYDTADFLKVDRTFGGEEALKELIEQAHKRGMKIVLDGVFNHVGNDSVYFDAYGKFGNGACSNKNSPFYEWFKFYKYPDEYESWWGITNLPKIIRCEGYMRFITEIVIPKYMKLGIDGWRLDVVDELEGDFLDRIVKVIKSYRSDAIVIGEVWEDASNKIAYNERKRYFRGTQLDSVTDYPVRNAVIEFVKYGNSRFLVETISTLYRHYPPHKLGALVNYLGSHDTERITTVLGGKPETDYEYPQLATARLAPDERARTKELLKNAYLLLASLPGVPCIYYGDEIAMEGYRDPFNRRPFPERGFEDSYSDFFKKVNQIRLSEPLFKATELQINEETQGVVRLTRINGNERLVVVANMSENDYTAAIPSHCVNLLTMEEYNSKVSVPSKTVVALKVKS